LLINKFLTCSIFKTSLLSQYFVQHAKSKERLKKLSVVLNQIPNGFLFTNIVNLIKKAFGIRCRRHHVNIAFHLLLIALFGFACDLKFEGNSSTILSDIDSVRTKLRRQILSI